MFWYGDHGCVVGVCVVLSQLWLNGITFSTSRNQIFLMGKNKANYSDHNNKRRQLWWWWWRRRRRTICWNGKGPTRKFCVFVRISHIHKLFTFATCKHKFRLFTQYTRKVRGWGKWSGRRGGGRNTNKDWDRRGGRCRKRVYRNREIGKYRKRAESERERDGERRGERKRKRKAERERVKGHWYARGGIAPIKTNTTHSLEWVALFLSLSLSLSHTPHPVALISKMVCEQWRLRELQQHCIEWKQELKQL